MIDAFRDAGGTDPGLERRDLRPNRALVEHYLNN
jgi:hypothetical protein